MALASTIAINTLVNATMETNVVRNSLNEQAIVAHRTPTRGRIVYAIVSLLVMCALSGMIATRAKPLWDSQARLANHRMLGIYMLTIEVLAVCFVFSAGLLLDGFDFTDERRCRGGIYLCLVFYVGAKALLYLFCVERAHLFRGPHVPRLRDWIYVLGMAIVVLGFGTIGILAFMHPVTSISAIDGLCRIGLPLFVTLPLLIYDILLNFMGVAVFYFIMGQSEVGLISWREIWLALTKMLPCAKDDRHPTFRVAFVGVFTKCFIGFVVAIVPTCVNLVILFFVNGHEQAWVCFLMCTIDVTLEAFVVHWICGGAGMIREAPAHIRAYNRDSFIELV